MPSTSCQPVGSGSRSCPGVQYSICSASCRCGGWVCQADSPACAGEPPVTVIAPILACAGFRLDQSRQRTHARMLEDLGDVDGAGPVLLDALMDRDQLQGAGTEVEEALIDLERAPLELGLADGAQALLDRIGGGERGGGGSLCPAQRRELCELGIEGTVQVLLLEQMTLYLAAGGLGYAPHRHHRVDLDT